jgi:hypothetical protein
MSRRVLAIPREEIEAHFAENSRQDLKMVTAELLSYDLFMVLRARGKDLKMEEPLAGLIWKHSGPELPNKVCPSGEFVDPDLPLYTHGPFAISFATSKSIQDEHYHKQHIEIMVTEHPISVEFRPLESTKCETITLPTGGILVVGPKVVHKLQLGGLTVLIEMPSLARDKVDEPLHPLPSA